MKGIDQPDDLLQPWRIHHNAAEVRLTDQCDGDRRCTRRLARQCYIGPAYAGIDASIVIPHQGHRTDENQC